MERPRPHVEQKRVVALGKRCAILWKEELVKSECSNIIHWKVFSLECPKDDTNIIVWDGVCVDSEGSGCKQWSPVCSSLPHQAPWTPARTSLALTTSPASPVAQEQVCH